MGRCSGCGEWNTMVEEGVEEKKARRGSAFVHTTTKQLKPERLANIVSQEECRVFTGSSEFDRVLGGGIVPGSMVLVGGDPGIGKSTILLQTSARLAQRGEKVLYISGEESLKQTKLRAERLGLPTQDLFVLSETDMNMIERVVDEEKPGFLIIDSIQTVYIDEIQSAPGSVTQVRECTAMLMKIAKSRGIAIFIVGHVTKQGSIAGPRLLEHMVDAVLYFEGERHHTFRILRAVKNRFGSTNEIGIFEMRESGLEEVLNPSEIFLEERTSGV